MCTRESIFVSLSGLFCRHTRKESVNCQVIIIIAKEASGSSVVFSERRTLSESRSDSLADDVFRLRRDLVNLKKKEAFALIYTFFSRVTVHKILTNDFF